MLIYQYFSHLFMFILYQLVIIFNVFNNYSCRYPIDNKKHWSSVLKKTAYTPSKHELCQHIKSITDSMPLAQEFLVSSSPENRSNSMFLGERWAVINTNIV